MAEAVVQQGGRVLAGYSPPLTTAGHAVHGGQDDPGGLGLTPPKRGDGQGTVGPELAPGGVGDRLRLRDERRAFLQLARVCVQEDAGPDREGELTECPRVTRELDVTAGQDVPCLVVPHRHGHPSGEPQPAQPLLRRDVLAAEGEQRPSQGGRPGCTALRDQQRQAVQEQIGGARQGQGRGRHTCGCGHAPASADRRRAWRSPKRPVSGAGSRPSDRSRHAACRCR